MDKDATIRNFIRKRELFRKMRFVSLLGLVFYGIVLADFFPALTMGEYEKAYKMALVLITAVTFFLGRFVSTTLSMCPVCHIQIPTITPNKKIGRVRYGKVPGLGPLPDYCPHCGANFRDNK